MTAEAHEYDREYTVVLSDWTFEDPERILANLKRYGGYYNFQRRTLANLPEEASRLGFWQALGDRLTWARMRMDSTDLADVTGVTYTYLINGLGPQENRTGLFSRGERVRLRFINASAATYFDVRVPGLAMEVIQADGMNVASVEVDEFRLAVAETLDVLVTPTEQAHTIFLGRSCESPPRGGPRADDGEALDRGQPVDPLQGHRDGGRE